MSHPYPTVGVAKPFSRKHGLAWRKHRLAWRKGRLAWRKHRLAWGKRGLASPSADSLGFLVIRRRLAGDRVQAAWLMRSANEVGRWAARHRCQRLICTLRPATGRALRHGRAEMARGGQVLLVGRAQIAHPSPAYRGRRRVSAPHHDRRLSMPWFVMLPVPAFE